MADKNKVIWFVTIGVLISVAMMVFFINEGGLLSTDMGRALRIVIAAVKISSGEDVAAAYLIVALFALAAVGVYTWYFPKLLGLSDRYGRIARPILHVLRLPFFAAPALAALLASAKLSPWLVIVMLLITWGAMGFVSSGLWIRRRDNDG